MIQPVTACSDSTIASLKPLLEYVSLYFVMEFLMSRMLADKMS